MGPKPIIATAAAILVTLGLAHGTAIAQPVQTEPEAVLPITLLLRECQETDRRKCANQVRPRGNPQSWVTVDDYPSGAWRRKEEGVAHFRLSVHSGRVTNCEVIASSGSKELDDLTCRLMTRRGRFHQQAEGVTQNIDGQMTWVLPLSPPPSPPPRPRRPPPQSLIENQLVYGDPSDAPICWVDAVHREGSGFRIYLQHVRRMTRGTDGEAIEVVPGRLPDGKGMGGSFYLGLGEAALTTNSRLNYCFMKVVEEDGRPAVQQHSVFIRN